MFFLLEFKIAQAFALNIYKQKNGSTKTIENIKQTYAYFSLPSESTAEQHHLYLLHKFATQ